MLNIDLIKNPPLDKLDAGETDAYIFEHISTGAKFTAATTNDGRIRLYSLADDTGNSDTIITEDSFNQEYKRVK